MTRERAMLAAYLAGRLGQGEPVQEVIVDELFDPPFTEEELAMISRARNGDFTGWTSPPAATSD